MFVFVLFIIIMAGIKVISHIDPTTISFVLRISVLFAFFAVLMGYFWLSLKVSKVYMKKKGILCETCGCALTGVNYKIVIEKKHCPKCQRRILE